MARKRYSVKQHELGTSVPELCRKLDIAGNQWRARRALCRVTFG